MKVIAEFTPRHLEKALDLARHVATFGCFEFTVEGMIRLRVTDPAKVVHLDLQLIPDIYKIDQEFCFGVHLNMFYRMFKSLDNERTVEIEADESYMKINQSEHHHTLVAQKVPFVIAHTAFVEGPMIRVASKLFQRYIRTLSNVAAHVELNYVPASDTLFLESVNSMYRTLFSMDTSQSPNEQLSEEYKKRFMLKFLEVAINPSLSDTVALVLGEDALRVHYEQPNLLVDAAIAVAYTEG